MRALISTSTQRTERVFLIGVDRKGWNGVTPRESLDELAELSTTAGGIVVGEGIQRLGAPAAATFIGSGKALEYAGECREKEVDTIIFDEELSPAQSRNLEKIFDCKILDRTSLILDIFAMRARTREGKMQVELAQLQHLLPRLTRFWSHLSRQKGGIGMRGDGELAVGDRPASCSSAHRKDPGGTRDGEEAAGNATSREATQPLAACVNCRLYKRWKIDNAELPDGSFCSGGRQTLCDPGPNHEAVKAANQPERAAVGYGRFHPETPPSTC